MHRRPAALLLLLTLAAPAFTHAQSVTPATPDPLTTSSVSLTQEQKAVVIAQLQQLIVQLTQQLQTIIATRTGQGTGGNAPSVSTCTISRTLALGMRGDDVTCLQTYLIAQHLLAPGSATGYFGPLTRAAVIALQTSRGLEPVGFVGKLTRAIVNDRSIIPAPQTIYNSTSTSVGSRGIVLPPGIHSASVDFSTSPASASGDAPLDVSFIAPVGDAHTGALFVEFGDGQSGAVQSGGCPDRGSGPCWSPYISHTYTSAGTYAAKLKRTMSSSDSTLGVATITVTGQTTPNPPPIAPPPNPIPAPVSSPVAPVISSVLPLSGPSGTVVTITGSGFTPAGNHVGITNDYMQLFDEAAPWVAARSYVRVFELPLNIEKFPDSALAKIIAYSNKHDIGLAIAVAMLPVSDSCPVNEGASTRDYAQIAARIKRLGGTVRYIVGDQPLYTGTGVCNMSASDTARHAAATAQKFKAVFPDLRVVQTEPVAINEWKGDMNALMTEYLSAFKNTYGQPVSAVQMDVFWRNPKLAWQGPVSQLAQTLATNGVQAAVIYDSDSAAISDIDWLSRAAQNYQTYESLLGIPAIAVFQSWNKHPFRSLPETSPTAFTHLINQYVAEHATSRVPEIWFQPQDAFDEIYAAASYIPSADGTSLTFSIPGTLRDYESFGTFGIFAQNASAGGVFSNDAVFTITGNLASDGATLAPDTNASLVTIDGTWTLGTAKVAGNAPVLLNNQSAAGGYAVKLVVAQSGKMFAMSSDGNWYVWTGSTWSPATNPYPPQSSPDGSSIIAGTSGSLITTQGTWTFGTVKVVNDTAVLLNNQSAGGGYAAQLIVAQGGKMFARSSNGQWWQWVGSQWTAANSPL